MELIIKNDSNVKTTVCKDGIVIKHDNNVKITVCKDGTFISRIVGEEDKSSSVIQKVDGISVKVGI